MNDEWLATVANLLAVQGGVDRRIPAVGKLGGRWSGRLAAVRVYLWVYSY